MRSLAIKLSNDLNKLFKNLRSSRKQTKTEKYKIRQLNIKTNCNKFPNSKEVFMKYAYMLITKAENIIFFTEQNILNGDILKNNFIKTICTRTICKKAKERK